MIISNHCLPKNYLKKNIRIFLNIFLMRNRTGRYSGYIRPFSYALDLIIINILAYFLLPDTLNQIGYHLFVSASWIIIAWNIGFYEVYRYTKVIEILGNTLKQYFLFLIVNFAFIGFYLKFSEPSKMIQFVSLSILLIALAKFFVYYALRRFRLFLEEILEES